MGSRAEQLLALGQSVWLDFIRRRDLHDGGFMNLVHDAGVVGVTSNPTIFQQAISGSADYDASLHRHAAAGLAGPELFEALAIEDIQQACDQLASVAEMSGGLDGRV
ncbi:MAG: transaldolase family protein, partial [Candidatus Eisenbacteria bacterium]